MAKNLSYMVHRTAAKRKLAAKEYKRLWFYRVIVNLIQKLEV